MIDEYTDLSTSEAWINFTAIIESMSICTGSSLLWMEKDKPSMHAHNSASNASRQENNYLQEEKMMAPLSSLNTIPAPADPSTANEPSVHNLTQRGLGAVHLGSATTITTCGRTGVYVMIDFPLLGAAIRFNAN